VRAPRRLALPAVITAGLIAGAAAPPAIASSAFTIRTSGGLVSSIGGFHARSNPTVDSTMRTFGRPSRLKPIGRGSGCVVDWRRLRLRIEFWNFGAVPGGTTSCTPSVGLAQAFVARGSRFRTWEGLRPGMRSSAVLERHHAATFRQGAWWLRTATSPFGDEQEYAVVRALVRSGRVSALAGWIGGAGE